MRDLSTTLAAVVPFVAASAVGAIITGVIALFVYVNVTDVGSRDEYFAWVGGIGLICSFLAGYIAGRRAHQAGANGNVDAEVGLLNKYRRKAATPGADSQTGHYRIGEQYLRDLMKRRGA